MNLSSRTSTCRKRGDETFVAKKEIVHSSTFDIDDQEQQGGLMNKNWGVRTSRIVDPARLPSGWDSD